MKAGEISAKLENGGYPTYEEIQFLNKEASKLLSASPNVVELESPVTVCGDIHGQFDDLLELFRIGGHLPLTSYVFLGDYVDRGSKSVQVISYLLALKIQYPKFITLLRGNHESEMTAPMGFRDEIIQCFGSDELYKLFLKTFQTLPIAAQVYDAKHEASSICLHGGISQFFQKIEEISHLDRFIEIPRKGPITDILWADPGPQDGWNDSPRGISFLFGEKQTEEWTKANKILFTLRGHVLKTNGIDFEHDKKIITVFSAPNYCYNGNTAGIIELDEHLNTKCIRFGSPLTNPDIPAYYTNE